MPLSEELGGDLEVCGYCEKQIAKAKQKPKTKAIVEKAKESETIICVVCRSLFYEVDGCHYCKMRLEDEAKRKKERVTRRLAKLFAEFEVFSTAKTSWVKPTAYRKLLLNENELTNTMIAGSTGSGKTTTAFKLARKFVEDDKGYALAVFCGGFSNTIQDMTSGANEDKTNASAKFKAYCTATLLIIDDLDKLSPVGRTQKEFGNLLIRRINNKNLITIITSKYEASWLNENFESSLAEDCIRRIREFFFIAREK